MAVDRDRVAAAVRGRDGVEQVAPFGNDLHVVGPDPERLRAAVEAAVAERGGGVTAEAGATGLEDVFIRLMQQAALGDAPATGRQP